MAHTHTHTSPPTVGIGTYPLNYLGRVRFINSNSGKALPSDCFSTSSGRALLLFHLTTWKYEAVDRSNMAAMDF